MFSYSDLTLSLYASTGTNAVYTLLPATSTARLLRGVYFSARVEGREQFLKVGSSTLAHSSARSSYIPLNRLTTSSVLYERMDFGGGDFNSVTLIYNPNPTSTNVVQVSNPGTSTLNIASGTVLSVTSPEMVYGVVLLLFIAIVGVIDFMRRTYNRVL